MKTIAVIPARWGSTRFEGKVLASIAGKPMIQHVWQRCKQAQELDQVWIACDDERIKEACQRFGAQVILTSKLHSSGSDRIAEALKQIEGDIIVNVQGDEPTIEPAIIDNLVKAFKADAQSSMATVIKAIDRADEMSDPNVVKVVVDQDFHALYFSRSAIPYNRAGKKIVYYKHLGIYAYRRDFLMKFTKWPKSPLEETEKLEQLRALEAGYKIKTILTDIETIAVDTPADLARAQAKMQEQVR